MTHTSTEQPEALRLARWLEHRSMSGVKPNDLAAAAELRRLHARVQELEFRRDIASACFRNISTASQAQRVPLSGSCLAYIGAKHFGNPIPREWYSAARDLETTHGITQEKHYGE